MEATRIAELTPRSLWDITDDAFDLYRERFVLLFGAAAVVFVPAYLLRLFLIAGPYAAYYRQVARNPTDAGSVLGASGGMLGYDLLLLPLLMLAGSLFGAVAAEIVRDRLERDEIRTIAQAYRPVLRRFGSVFFGSLLAVVATALGYVLCFLPAVYIGIALILVPQTIVLEERSIGSAFQRSQDLIRHNFARAFGLTALLAAMTLILNLGFSGLIEGATATFSPGVESPAIQTQKTLLEGALGGIVNLMLAPVSGVALALLYFDIRVRREGLDMVARAKSEGITLAPDPFGDVSSEEALKLSRRLGGQRR
ncbi:MAG: hypothetical protein SFU56_18480 [Capsulimonadales bacterium]|nr:hypothetical protein [Capsulimonadales bacterium]